MGSGGSTLAAIVSLKYNRQQIKATRDRLRNKKDQFGIESKKQFLAKKNISAEKLSKIKWQIRKDADEDKRKKRITDITVLIIVFSLLIYFTLYTLLQ